jgi:hypothetical protein
MYKMPNPLTLDTARALMNDRRYQDKSHPEYGDYVKFVTDAFRWLYPEAEKKTIRIGPVTAEPDTIIPDTPPVQVAQARNAGPAMAALPDGGAPNRPPASEPDPGQRRLQPAGTSHEFAIPSDKQKVVRGDSYDAFLKALRERPSMLGAKARRAFANTYAWEGGMMPDPSSGAVAGIMPKTLRDLKNFEERPGVKSYAYQIGDLPDDPRKLTPEQAARFHETYLNHTLRTVTRNDPDRRSGVDLIDDIDDPKTAAMLVDTLIRHGSGDGALAIQKAINKTLSEVPTELREALGWQVPDPDGKMGPGTFAFFRDIANFGLQTELRKNLKETRDKLKELPGDKARTSYFTDPD